MLEAIGANPKELNVGVIGLGVGEAHIADFEKDKRCRDNSSCLSNTQIRP